MMYEINQETRDNIAKMFIESMKNLTTTNIINDFNVNFASECVGWKIKTNRNYTHVLYVLANGEMHYGPKFKSRRIARVYAKKTYLGKLIMDFNIMPVAPVNYISLTMRVK